MIRYGIIICFFLARTALGQDFKQEINEQVWKLFMKSYSDMNVTAFMSIHSPDLARVVRDSKTVSTFEEYKQSNEADAKWAAENKTKRSIEFRFLERIASATQAYEVGIYKVVVSSPGREPRSYYGKFHVVLRKENSYWKILVDSDSSEEGTVNEASFLKGYPLE